MRIQVEDIKLFFDIEGLKLRPDGPAMRQVPTLLLVHGGPGFDHSGFKPAFTEMTAVVQVVYLDLRGNGRSDAGPANKWSLEQWAEDAHWPDTKRCAFRFTRALRRWLVSLSERCAIPPSGWFSSNPSCGG